ncbi:MAG: hypothetical protein AAGC54_16705 [Cyanobacteria bacterium P01_F01_bin.4]
MTHRTLQYRIALTGGVLSYSAHLLMAQNARAHTNHDHTKKTDFFEKMAPVLIPKQPS